VLRGVEEEFLFKAKEPTRKGQEQVVVQGGELELTGGQGQLLQTKRKVE